MSRVHKIHRIKCGNGNCYIVESIKNPANAVLVDTGKREYVNQVLQACKPYSIKLIVLTHAHFDHAENAARLSEELGAPIAMSERDCNLIESNFNQALSASTLLGKIVLYASLKEFKSRAMLAFSPTVLLKDGDSLSDYGIDARIISLPGHTDGSIGIDVDSRDLIVGDALMNMFYPTVSMLYHDKKMMLESAKKISNIGERMICFGHGKPMPNRAWVK